jgi:hypothetical protein
LLLVLVLVLVLGVAELVLRSLTIVSMGARLSANN